MVVWRIEWNGDCNGRSVHRENLLSSRAQNEKQLKNILLPSLAKITISPLLHSLPYPVAATRGMFRLLTSVFAANSQCTTEGHTSRQTNRGQKWTVEADICVVNVTWTNNWGMQMGFLKSPGCCLTSLSISKRGNRQQQISLNMGKWFIWSWT